ncbi:CynX/NimT family MFS transporter [Mycetocola spongiae]|uniref:CynX/NimT family MFS transporter n=1 Tax=Mycetocola spongiae TaxID=2859226 RepID=UPI001CF2D6C9|nr:MFS transporter [Mycetocola spongiae]UCR88887.1 MFS transporter [Mycetocola spongiae]
MTSPLPRPHPGLLLVGILLVGANLRAGITAVGPVLGDIQADLGISAAVASILISIPLIAFAVVSPLAPVLATRVGMERALGLALAVLAAAIVIRSLPWAPGIWLGTALLGIAIAVLNVVLPSLIKRDFPDRVGSVTGLYSAVQGAAAAAASGIAVPIAGLGNEGWRLALGVWAGLALIALAVFWPQLRTRTLPRAHPAGESTPRRSPWTSALAWQVTAFMGLQSTLFYAAITWLPSIERSAGIGAGTAGLHLLEMQLFGVLANILTAAILQRTRSQSLLAVVVTALAAVGVIGLALAPGNAAIWVAFIGLGCGSTIVIALSLFGLRAVDHHQAAALSGMAQAVGYTFAALGPIAIGLLHDATRGWDIPLLTLLIILVAQAIAGALAGRDRRIGEAHPRRTPARGGA